MKAKIYKIKLLEWQEHIDEDEKSYYAETPFGRYTVTQVTDEESYRFNECLWGYCFDEYYDESKTTCASISEGKSLAEKHWLAGIGGALIEVKKK